MQIFDMDSHLREHYFMDEVYKLEGKFAQYTPVRIGDGRDVRTGFRHKLNPWPQSADQHFNHNMMYDPSARWNGGELARLQTCGYDMALRMAENDKEGIDFQFLFPTVLSIPTYTEGELGAALCRAYNDWVKRLVKGREDRLWPIGILPWGHPAALVDELRRCVQELKFKAVHLTPYTFTHTIDDPVFEPLYAEAERLEVPLMLHPQTQGELTNRFNSFFPMHVLGRPLNCTAGLVALVTGGVFERHPGLRVAFFECSAEWILYWMHRMDDDYTRVKSGFAPNISRPPSEYIRRNCYVTCEVDEVLLGHALAEFSEDRVLLATDFPHFDSEFPGTVHKLRARGDISAKQKEKILHHNAREFLRL